MYNNGFIMAFSCTQCILTMFISSLPSLIPLSPASVSPFYSHVLSESLIRVTNRSMHKGLFIRCNKLTNAFTTEKKVSPSHNNYQVPIAVQREARPRVPFMFHDEMLRGPILCS